MYKTECPPSETRTELKVLILESESTKKLPINQFELLFATCMKESCFHDLQIFTFIWIIGVNSRAVLATWEIMHDANCRFREIQPIKPELPSFRKMVNWEIREAVVTKKTVQFSRLED